MINWPSVNHVFPAGKQIDHAQIVRDTLTQVEKDFMMQGFDIVMNSDSENYDDIVGLLTDQLLKIKLIEHPRLPGLLYQLDLNEAKIAGELTNADPTVIYSVLADSIVKKCFEKVCWRHQFKA